MKIAELQEAIKGWKNAQSDIMKMRAAQRAASHAAKLVSVKKDGTESRMHDAISTYPTEAEARARHEDLVKMNPGRNITHNLYVDNQFVEKLTPQLAENASSGSTSSGSVASLPMNMGKVIRQPNLFGYVPNYKKPSQKSGKKKSSHK